MPATLPSRIELTKFEQALFEQINFGSDPGYEAALASGRASRQLMESLIKRDAIPAIRWGYFTDPFPGGRGKSHAAVFQANLQGRNLFEDPTFIVRYLRYFIFGPDQPRETMRRFCEIVADDDIERLRSFVCQETRKAGLINRTQTAEEFYKLALECFPDDPFTPGRIREAAMKAR
jgi:hypothetical protein